HGDSGKGLEPIEPGPLADNPPAMGPAGTVHCSLADWAKFVIAHLEAGRKGRRLLKASTFRKLHSPSFGGDYASGWIARKRPWGGGRVFTHAGSNNANFCVVWMAPQKRFAVLVATNCAGGDTAKACDEAVWMLIQSYLLDRTKP
ncbi:MAG: serine hydrolase, partial [Phycisphaerae bacterium]